jgi:hypothetical protein
MTREGAAWCNGAACARVPERQLATDAPRPGENKVPKQDLAVGLCALRGTSATRWRSMDA